MSFSPPDRTPRLGLAEMAGFGALVFFIFSIFSGSVDVLVAHAPFLKALRPSLVAAVLGLSAIALSGRGGVLIRNKVAILFIALTAWFVLCVPFSIWPGGAARTVGSEWLVTALSLFLAGGLIWNSDQFRKVVHVIAYSAILLALISLVAGAKTVDGRLILANTRYGNPNELATDLVTALPFLVFMAMRRGNGIRRLLAVAGFAPILLAIAETGSRAALLGFGVAGLALFLSVSVTQKMKLLVAGAAIFGMLMLVIPGHISKRLFTFFGSTLDSAQIDEETQSTIESSQARRMLLLDSITITLQHPIFGVGAGNFAVAQDRLAKSRGQAAGNWHVTHNSFTQVSSESGLPGLIMFLMAIYYSLRSITRTMRMPVPAGSVAWRDIHMIAFTLRISTISLLSCAFFDSMAYVPVIAVMLGLTISLDYCTQILLAHPLAAPAWRPQPARFAPARPVQALPVRQYPGQRVPNRI